MVSDEHLSLATKDAVNIVINARLNIIIPGVKYMNKNKYMGISKVGEKGQIVIPKEVRDIFDIKPGDSLIVLADAKKGIALVKSEVIEDVTNNILGGNDDKNK